MITESGEKLVFQLRQLRCEYCGKTHIPIAERKIQQLNNFHRYFDSEGNALTKKLNIGAEKSVEVPLMSLVPQNSLIMDEVDIEFDAKLDEVTPKLTEDEYFESSVRQAEISLSHPSAKDNRLVHVKLHFKSAETPEGISRILDENNKLL